MPSAHHRRVLVSFLLATAAALSPAGTARAADGPDKPAFVALGEFTVNLPPGNDTLTYLVIDVTVEAMPDAAAALSEIMPRLKEAVVRRLMAMAAHGDLQPQRIDLAVIEKSLLEGIGKVRPNSLRDVLVTRLLFG